MGAAAGFAFAGIVASTYLVVPRMPVAGADPEAVRAYVATHQAALRWTWFLAGEVAWLPGLLFCAVLASSLGEDGGAPAASLGMVGAAVTASVSISASVPWGLLVYLGPVLQPRDTVLLLAETRHFADAAIGFPTAAMLAGFGLAAAGSARRPRALVALAGLAAAFQVLHGVDDFATGGQTGALWVLAGLSTPLWALAASAWLVRVARAPAAEVAARIRPNAPRGGSRRGAATRAELQPLPQPPADELPAASPAASG